MIELINRIVYDEIKNHSGLVMYLALLEFNLRENVVMVFKLTDCMIEPSRRYRFNSLHCLWQYNLTVISECARR